MKETLIRIWCVLLGVFLTLSTMKIGSLIEEKSDMETVLVEEISIVEASAVNEEEEVLVAENVKLFTEYEEEAKEKYEEMQDSQNEEIIEEKPEFSIETVSANSIEAAPVKWIKDYPAVNSEKALEEKLAERSSYEETLAVNAFDKEVIKNSIIDFSDVKISIMGDSITTGVGLAEEEIGKYAYPNVLKEILGCKEIVNFGIGGSSVSRAGVYAMVDRWSAIPKDSDIIIVFGGSNDCLFENIWQFGNIEYDRRMRKETFCGDLDEMAGAMRWTYRKHNEDNYVKFIYINPPSTILNESVSQDGNMVHQSEFAKAINTIVPEYGFEVIDLYNNNILNSYDKDINEQFVPDGIHPNVEGHRILAEHIASQIIQRIEQ